MIDFPEDYFKTEIRDGFEITSMMKRAMGRTDGSVTDNTGKYAKGIIYYGLLIMVLYLEQ